ncbi:polyprenyl synthetase family protein [Candidatus Gottesmanbacteria bacterium]|nr:polyprenyl synthetase family protein [Candidatus Gottesmanbacteria bacterium]
MVFQDGFTFVKKEVGEGLEFFFTKKKREAKKISRHCTLLVDQVTDFTMRGGKRTRAFLVWLGHETARESRVKSKTSQELLQTMMAIELFQSFALIHDDIIDQDSVRRGGPTVHEFFRIHASTHQRINPRKAQHFGTSMAILAGDLALVWADELMEKVKSQESRDKSEDIYQRMKQEVILGQSLDVLAAAGLPSADRATINRYKTAWYSVIRPLQIGAAIAGADEKMIASFVPYGLVVGEAYQLRDDFLDGAISEEEFQKKAKKLVIPKSATILLTEFARFVLTRQS